MSSIESNNYSKYNNIFDGFGVTRPRIKPGLVALSGLIDPKNLFRKIEQVKLKSRLLLHRVTLFKYLKSNKLIYLAFRDEEDLYFGLHIYYLNYIKILS